MKRTDRPLAPRLLLCGAAALMLFCACSAVPATAIGWPVSLTLRDFHIDGAKASVNEGTVAFHIHNASPSTHEFILVRTDLAPAQLPTSPDGLGVDEEKLVHVGEIAQVDAGSTRTLVLTLTPGSYVYFCNLDGHYPGGMHGVLEVSG